MIRRCRVGAWVSTVQYIYKGIHHGSILVQKYFILYYIYSSIFIFMYIQLFIKTKGKGLGLGPGVYPRDGALNINVGVPDSDAGPSPGFGLWTRNMTVHDRGLEPGNMTRDSDSGMSQTRTPGPSPVRRTAVGVPGSMHDPGPGLETWSPRLGLADSDILPVSCTHGLSPGLGRTATAGTRTRKRGWGPELGRTLRDSEICGPGLGSGT
jgi:hypothetical protein